MISDCPPDAFSVTRESVGFSTRLTRRTLLLGSAALVASAAWSASASAETAAAPGSSTFHDVSRAATGKTELSVVTSERIFKALLGDDDQLPGKIDQLAKFAQTAASPEALKAAADGAGLTATLMAIITAWYTGTVQTKAGPVVVAYQEALMYRPVADGLTVPTYCNKGPIWWTGLPPEITVMPSNLPKVL